MPKVETRYKFRLPVLSDSFSKIKNYDTQVDHCSKLTEAHHPVVKQLRIPRVVTSAKINNKLRSARKNIVKRQD